VTGLAIDSAADILSLALVGDSGSYAIEIDAGLRHSERLMEAADALFSLARVDRAALGFVACMRGPGSFTGLRIGMATAKGLSAALEIPLYALPTLECFAASRAAWPGAVLPVIDAKQNRWYAAAFRGGKRLLDDMDADAAAIAAALQDAGAREVLVCGPDAPRAAAEISSISADLRLSVDPGHRGGAALDLARLARAKAEAGIPGEDDGVGLDYLRKSEAETTREAKAGRA